MERLLLQICRQAGKEWCSLPVCDMRWQVVTWPGHCLLALNCHTARLFLMQWGASSCCECTAAHFMLLWPVQVIFLGRLSVIETTKLTERLTMFLMLKIVFFGELVHPPTAARLLCAVTTSCTWFLLVVVPCSRSARESLTQAHWPWVLETRVLRPLVAVGAEQVPWSTPPTATWAPGCPGSSSWAI